MKLKIAAVHAVKIGGDSINATALQWGLTATTLRRAVVAVGDSPPAKWEGILSDKRAGASGRRAGQKLNKKFWNLFFLDWMRPEQPTLKSAYDRTAERATTAKIPVAPIHTVRRAVKKLCPMQVAAARHGLEALNDKQPPQQRHVVDLRALQCINGDGLMLDCFVQPKRDPDGTQRDAFRPKIWVWQCVASRKVVGWCLAETESAEMLLGALASVVVNHGVPESIYLDNTRAASATWLSGSRRRFAAAPRDFAGVFGECGIEVHRTSLVPTLGKTASGRTRHVGRGQAKPVERLFRWMQELISRHPAAAGAYTGNSPTNKPENYSAGRVAISWETAEQLIADAVKKTNAAANRRAAPLSNGESADERFAALFAAAPPRPATDDILDALLSPAESTAVTAAGEFGLRAGAAAGFGANRYGHESLLEYAGQRVLVRYDPTNLHAPVFVNNEKGKRICTASVFRATGFNDIAAAGEYNRARRQKNKSVVQTLAADRRMAQLETESIAAAPAPQTAGDDKGNIIPMPRRATGTDGGGGNAQRIADAYAAAAAEQEI